MLHILPDHRTIYTVQCWMRLMQPVLGGVSHMRTKSDTEKGMQTDIFGGCPLLTTLKPLDNCMTSFKFSDSCEDS